MNVHAPTPSLLPHVCGTCHSRDSDPTWHRQPAAGVVSPRREHVHEWTDAPDDETAWYCPGCGVTEYPDEPPYGAEDVARSAGVEPAATGFGDRRDAEPRPRANPTAVARRTDPSTSWEAARSVSGIRESQQHVLELFRTFGPMTDEDMHRWHWRAALPGGLQSPSGLRTRRSELVRAGLLRDTGQRKVGSTGRKMIVWGAA